MMKKILLLFSLSVALSAKGQTSVYHPFPDSNAIWRIDWGDASCYQSSWPQAKYRYVMRADTLINGYSYHKIYREFSRELYVFLCAPFYPPDSGYMGGLRQDTSVKKVYFIPNDSTSEKLIYDFSLNVGDILPNFILRQWGFAYATITSIDSMLIGATYRKVYDISGSGFEIEGIGHMCGLLEFGHMDLSPGLCFIQDGIQLFNYDQIDCSFITDVHSIYVNDDIKVFPNPAHNQIEINGTDIQAITLYDVLGRVIWLSNSEIISPLTINTSSFSRGIYFLQAQTRGGVVVRKVVLE